MSLNREELKALALEFAAAMPPEMHRMEVVAVTGEMRSEEAMNLARLYDRSTNLHRAALDAVAEVIRASNESGASR